MHRDDQRIMAGRNLAATSAKQPCGIGAGDGEFNQPLGSHEAEDGNVRPQLGHASITIPAQVKPGPKAVIITRFGSPRASKAWSTNITVGALILP